MSRNRELNMTQMIERALDGTWDLPALCDELKKRDAKHARGTPSRLVYTMHRTIICKALMMRLKPDPKGMVPKDFVHAWVATFCLKHDIAIVNQTKLTSTLRAIYPDALVRRKFIHGNQVEMYVGITYLGEDPGWEYQGIVEFPNYSIPEIVKMWTEVVKGLDGEKTRNGHESDEQAF
ncbi:unnamed protein product [Kuraishia capsulata CBS 1993]|uniref:RFX-type winged-helix domain-containing protein n=1 Tax=Kuraishia capsulata CBS 1993 TaxID=1382522 RepID=W6MF84_9ASCO|nr:uncharacterized protein KUCA_T00000071001 [Kuraishia capsulata CBS 1993]CDK24111.1 unnamed protein product [Kuraishia capsulata CBS 1993]